MKKILATLLLAVACQPPAPGEPSTTTVPATSSTVVATSSTSSPQASTTLPPSPGNILLPSGSDDTQRLVSAVSQYQHVIIDGGLRIDSPAVIASSNRKITFTSRGSLNRTSRPEKVTWQVLVLKNAESITIDNLKIIGPNIEVCNWMWYPPPPYNLNQSPRFIHAGYNRNYESQHGLEIRGGSNITINGGSIYGVSGDGLYLDDHPNNVVINDLSTECTGRSSISNVGSANVTVNRGRFHRSGMWIFNIEPYNTHYVHNYSINQAKVGFSNLTWLFSSGPYFSCDIKNIKISVDKSGSTFDLAPSTYAPTIKPCVASQFQIQS